MRPHLLYVLASSCLLAACASKPPAPTASALLQPTKGNTATGTVQFTQLPGKVLVSGTISGLAPNATLGFHLHEKGDCSSGDGMSAGGHFNPDGHNHGAANSAMHHAGDLPSLQTDAQGVAKFSFESTSLSVGIGPHDVIGHGLIVHRDADDFTTQPTGNSGPRTACAVVRAG